MGDNEEDMDMEVLSSDDIIDLLEPNFARYAQRQNLASDLLDTVLTADDGELEGMAKEICSFLQDPESLIRARVADQMEDILSQYVLRGQKACAVEQLLPATVGLMVDSFAQVRLAARRRVVEMIVHRVLDTSAIVAAVLPMLKTMAAHPGEEVRTETLAFMAETAEIFGAAFAQDHFVPLLQMLCTDAIFRVRKSCPPCLVNVGFVVGAEFTSEILLPLFAELTRDNIWGVRKACAEVMHTLSLSVTLPLRHTEMTSLFSSLATDSSRWVRSAAFKVLGPFIASFKPAKKSQAFDDGPAAQPAEPSPAPDTDNSDSEEAPLQRVPQVVVELHDDDNGGARESETDPPPADTPTTNKDPRAGDEEYNSFAYWRTPVEEFDIDAILAEGADPPASAAVSASVSHNSSILHVSQSSSAASPAKAAQGQHDVSSDELPFPDKLLEFFNSMVDPDSPKEIDGEVMLMCAYSFPAVALVLGPRHWPLIRGTYMTLSASDEWKIRATLAHSIQVLGEILGPEITETDLLPKFDWFLKDWDEVRIGVIKRFAKFLQLLSSDKRAPYLPVLGDLREEEESHNWRCRRLLAQQLRELAGLYPQEDVQMYICPVALRYATDQVACVNIVAQQTLARILAELSSSAEELAADFAAKVVEELCKSTKSVRRQGFVRVCYHYAMSGQSSFFVKVFLDGLLDLAADPVPNVRLMVAKLLNSTITGDYVGVEQAPRVTDALDRLTTDEDRDVVQSATRLPGHHPLRSAFEMPDYTDDQEDFDDLRSPIASYSF